MKLIIKLALVFTTVPALEPFAPLKEWTEDVVAPRLHFVYPDSVLEAVGGSLQIRVIDQMMLENTRPRSTPLLEYNAEIVYHERKPQVVHVGGLIARTENSATMEIVNYPNFMIKYRSNCDALGQIHPLMRDFLFRREFRESGMALRATSLSPEAKLRHLKTTKTDFSISSSNRIRCAGAQDSHVRYFISERPLQSLGSTVQGLARGGRAVGFGAALNYLERLVEILQEMHSKSVVHGNLTPGNVVRVMRDGSETLAIADFEYAFFAEEYLRSPVAPAQAFLDSHWRRQGQRPGFRDDLLRVIELTAYAMHGPAYFARCNSMSEEEFVAFKQDGFIFSPPGISSVTDNLLLLAEEADSVWAKLGIILSIARSVPTRMAPPNYGAILEQIRDIRTITGTAVSIFELQRY